MKRKIFIYKHHKNGLSDYPYNISKTKAHSKSLFLPIYLGFNLVYNLLCYFWVHSILWIEWWNQCSLYEAPKTNACTHYCRTTSKCTIILSVLPDMQLQPPWVFSCLRFLQEWSRKGWTLDNKSGIRLC